MSEVNIDGSKSSATYMNELNDTSSEVTHSVPMSSNTESRMSKTGDANENSNSIQGFSEQSMSQREGE